jgi:hypothetical protein
VAGWRCEGGARFDGWRREACGQGWKVTLRVQLRAPPKEATSFRSREHARQCWLAGIWLAPGPETLGQLPRLLIRQGVVSFFRRRTGVAPGGASRSTPDSSASLSRLEHGHSGEDVIENTNNNQTCALPS